MKKLTSSLILLAVLGFVGGVAQLAHAQSTSFIPCGFVRDLEIGSVGDEVRCLQKYLNENGYKIADSGVGSPGRETNLFGSLTAEAVKRWQTAQGVPSTGYFGPKSQEAYLKHVATLASAQVAMVPVTPVVIPAAPAPLNPVVSAEDREEKEARELIRSVREQMDDLEDAIDDLDNDDADRADLEDDLNDAKDDIMDVYDAYFDEDYSKAISRAQDIKDSLDDAGTAIYGNKDRADQAIQDAEEDIDDASSEIDDADDDGDHVDNARDLLEDAEDKLDDARREFKRKKYDEAKSLAHEASDLADRAVDAIGD